jgi:7-cyano-7-deazaguanine reductase
MSKEGADLKQLGSGTNYAYAGPSTDQLETFPNQYPTRDYRVLFVFEEYTSLCPKTGQPDFGTIRIEYVPDKRCIETKSLKLYLFAFRQHGSFMETITNKILEDCVFACAPRWMRVTGDFKVRGGIQIQVVAEHNSD